MYGPGLTTMSGITSISAVLTWPEDVMRMFATGTQADLLLTVPTNVEIPTEAATTATVATATSTSGVLKGLEVPQWSLFSIVGVFIALTL